MCPPEITVRTDSFAHEGHKGAGVRGCSGIGVRG